MQHPQNYEFLGTTFLAISHSTPGEYLHCQNTLTRADFEVGTGQGLTQSGPLLRGLRPVPALLLLQAIELRARWVDHRHRVIYDARDCSPGGTTRQTARRFQVVTGDTRRP